MKRMMLTVLLLLSFVLGAQAERLESYPVEQMPGSVDWRFVSGVRVEDTEFLLLDSSGFNGCYLYMERGDALENGSLSGIEVPAGWTAEVDASDRDHCRLTLSCPEETRTYYFRFDQRQGWNNWTMERYTIQRAQSVLEAKAAGLWRMEVTQIGESGRQEKVRAAFHWYNECVNLTLDQLPRTMDDVRRLEEEQPVAAVAPQNPTDRVNLREGPGVDDPRIGSLFSGVLVRVLEEEGEWLKVNVMGGATKHGYIHRALLAFGEDVWDVPNATQDWLVSASSDTVPADQYPYHTSKPLSSVQTGSVVNVIGYYNDGWAIISDWPGALYVETKYLKKP